MISVKVVSGRRFWMPAALFSAVILIGIYLVNLNAKVRQDDQKYVTYQLVTSQAEKIQRILTHILSSTYILAQEVSHSNGDFNDFDKYAASVLEQFPGVANLQLAPLGITTQIYPLEGNEGAIGYNILNDDQRKDETMMAIDLQELTLAAPFKSRLGRIGIIGHNPIYIEQNHLEMFWGFSSAMIFIDELVDRAGLASIGELGYGYEFGRVDRSTNQQVIFSKNGTTLSSRAQTIDIKVPHDTWFLRVESPGVNDQLFGVYGYIGSFILALVIALLCRKLIDVPEQLRERVAVQTRDLLTLAYHDNLTGLPNRLAFYELLNKKLAAAKTSSASLALLLIDMDNFKEINDTLGHDNGDLLLIEFAQRIQQCLPESATLARLGGDEFTITLDHPIDLPGVESMCRNIINVLVQPFLLESQLVHMSGSIGIALVDDEIESPSDLLKCADLAMYDAKNKGRSGFCHYTESLQLASKRRLRLTNDLKDAVGNEELKLMYQPIICSSNGKLEKAEALIRWLHPELGTISPLEFIPLAESSGLIMSIGNWIFETAAKQVKHWQELYLPNFQISVNVSPIQLRSVSHVSRWIECLEELNLEGRSILIEITEGILLDNNSEMQFQLGKLQAIGIQFALDDFGTGYSSLSYLKHFPIDYLKIDQSFIQNLGTDNIDLFLCEMIIKIANKFGLSVVAEGVETSEQYEVLKQQNCAYVQGYYFSKPIEIEEIEARFMNNSGDNQALITHNAA